MPSPDNPIEPALASCGPTPIRIRGYESRAAVRILLERLPGLRLDDERPVELHGWEFRRPTHCHVRWDA